MKKRGQKGITWCIAVSVIVGLASPAAGASAEESRPTGLSAAIAEASPQNAAEASTMQAVGGMRTAAQGDLGFSSQYLPKAVVGENYTATVAVYGGEDPYTFTASGLPSGLALDPASGTISGVPDSGTEGTYDVALTLTDSAAVPSEAETTLQLIVNAPPVPGQAPAADTLQIRKIASYSVGMPNADGGVAEIVKFNKDNGKFYLVNGSSNPPSIDIVPLTGTGKLAKEKTINVKDLAERESGFTFGDLTSIDINTATRQIAAAVQEADPNQAGKILILDYDGDLLKEYAAGIQPDMVKYTSDGRYILTADEGEPREAGSDPEGSITIVDTTADQVTRVKFDDPAVIDDLVHIRGAADASGQIAGSGAKADALFDLEPEYIALSGDEKTAYVSLQEANAIATIDIAAAKATAVNGLGFKDLNDPRNALDLIEDGDIHMENVPFLGMYMPDGIDTYTVGGNTYLFTANEGDATEWDGRTNATTLGELQGIDPLSEAGRFLQDKAGIYADVEVASDMGTDGVYLYGARSFSVWKADGMQQVFDSGNDFERITAERLPDYFNSNHSKVNKDKRSPKKGPEPEYVTVGQVGNKAFAFTGLERIGGVMVYDVTDPEHPTFASYINTRDFSKKLDTDTGPEGLEFIPAPESPTGLPLLLVANEVGGTVAVLQLDVTKVSLDKTSLTLVAGGSPERLTATVSPVGGASGQVAWSTSDAKVATVGADGTVTPVAAGQAVITALSADGYGVGEALVTVTAGPDDGNNWKLTVMHTNDTHAHLADVARRAALVKQIRTEGGDSLLLDAGDVFSGDLYFTKWFGQADLDFMNDMGYDAMTFGNHEFDQGTTVLADFVKKAKFPLVSANVDFSKDGPMAPLLKSPTLIQADAAKTTANAGVYPYVVVDVGGHKVGIFGLTTEDTRETSSPGKNVIFNDATKAAQETVAAMEREGLNIIIGLSHLGYARDRKLAAEVEGIDLIVGGHTHTKLNAPEFVVDDVYRTPTAIVQANEWGKFLGRVNLVFDESGVVLTGPGQTDGGLIAVDPKTVAEEPDAKAKLDAYNAELEDLKKQVVGTTSVILDGERAHVRSKETNLGNLIADGMLYKAKQLKNADMAVTNGGGIRASIDQGDITMGELRTVMPFGNTLYVLDVTGQQLKDGLENGVSGAKLADLPGKFPQIAGMKFKWDPAKPAGSRVFDVQVKQGDGYKALDLAKTYRLATNSFMANGGDGYASFAQAIENGAYHEDLGYPDYEIFTEYVKSLGGLAAPVVEGRIVEQAKGGGGGNGGGNGGNGSSGNSGSGSTTSPAVAEPSKDAAADSDAHVLTGNEVQIEATRDADGQTLQVVTVKSATLQAALAAAATSDRRELVIELPTITDGTMVSLPAEAFSTALGADQDRGNVTLVVHTSLAAYRLPLQSLWRVLSADGGSVGGEASLQISILPAASADQAKLVRQAAAQNVTLIGSAALDFKLAIRQANGEEREISDFGSTYISRILPLPEGVQGNASVSAAMFDKATGALVFVPATRATVEGKPALEVKRPGNSLYALITHKKNFSDLDGHWAEQGIEDLGSKLLIQGMNGSMFAPGREVTRAEFAALLVRGLGLTPDEEANPFADVSVKSSFAGEIGAAVKAGIVKPEGTTVQFAPNESLTRAEMAVMTARAMRFALGGAAGAVAPETAAGTSAPGRFTDRSAVPDWAAADIGWLTSQGILQGDQRGAFRPTEAMTRAQAAVVLTRMLQTLDFID